MSHKYIARTRCGKIFEWCFGYFLCLVMLPIFAGAILGTVLHVRWLFRSCEYVGDYVSRFELMVLQKLFK